MTQSASCGTSSCASCFAASSASIVGPSLSAMDARNACCARARSTRCRFWALSIADAMREAMSSIRTRSGPSGTLLASPASPMNPMTSPCAMSGTATTPVVCVACRSRAQLRIGGDEVDDALVDVTDDLDLAAGNGAADARLRVVTERQMPRRAAGGPPAAAGRCAAGRPAAAERRRARAGRSSPSPRACGTSSASPSRTVSATGRRCTSVLPAWASSSSRWPRRSASSWASRRSVTSETSTAMPFATGCTEISNQPPMRSARSSSWAVRSPAMALRSRPATEGLASPGTRSQIGVPTGSRRWATRERAAWLT